MKQKSTKTSKNIIKTNSGSNKAKGDVWDLKELLNGKSFDQHIREITGMVEEFKKFRVMLNKDLNPEDFRKILLLEESIIVRAGKIGAYYEMKFAENTTDKDALAKMSQLKQLASTFSNDGIFFSLWFIALNDNDAKRYLESKDLQDYKYYLELLRKSKPYTKSEEIEKIINIKDVTGSGAFSDMYDIITSNYSFEIEGKKVSMEELVSYIHSDSPKLRKEAFDKLFTRFGQDITLLSEIYKNVVLSWYNDGVKIRGYKNPISIRTFSDDVTDKAVNAMMNTVKKNTKLFQEYFKLKYSINIKDGQKYPYSRYHLYAPVKIKEKFYNYEYCKNFTLETFQKFDPRFYNNALKIFDGKHIHSISTPNKRGGGFCSPTTTDVIPYIFLNHNNKLRDLFTMVHETGHAVHFVFANKNNNLQYHAGLPICETASVFSEMLLADRLLKESKDNNERKYVLVQLLDNQFATITRQTYITLFEQIAHDKILAGATSKDLEVENRKLLVEQFGDMDIPEVFDKGWAYIAHMFNHPFYCYSYSWGNLLVLSLFDMYKKEGKKFVDKYIKLLSAGGSVPPMKLLKDIEIDVESEEFWQRGFNIIREEIEELRKLK
jgi:oligoendopeptidase F